MYSISYPVDIDIVINSIRRLRLQGHSPLGSISRSLAHSDVHVKEYNALDDVYTAELDIDDELYTISIDMNSNSLLDFHKI